MGVNPANAVGCCRSQRTSLENALLKLSASFHAEILCAQRQTLKPQHVNHGVGLVGCERDAVIGFEGIRQQSEFGSGLQIGLVALESDAVQRLVERQDGA